MSQMLKILQTPPELIKKADVLEDIGKWMDENPLASKMLIGGGIGALGGAAFSDGRNTLRNAIAGGLLGASGGALYHYFSKPSDSAPNPGDGGGDTNNKGGENKPGTPPDIMAQTTQQLEARKKKQTTPEQYQQINSLLSKLGYWDQVRYIQNLLNSDYGIDTKQLNTLWTKQDLATGLAQMKSPRERAIYVTRFIQTGGRLHPSNKTYKSGARIWIGDEATDKLLDRFYSFDNHAREVAARRAGLRSLEELNRVAEEAQKNFKTILPGDAPLT